MKDRIEKRSVTLAGHRTSVSLEEPFWRHLKRIAHARGVTLGALIEEIDAARALTVPPGGNLSSALRLHVLADLERTASAAAALPGTKAANRP